MTIRHEIKSLSERDMEILTDFAFDKEPVDRIAGRLNTTPDEIIMAGLFYFQVA